MQIGRAIVIAAALWTWMFAFFAVRMNWQATGTASVDDPYRWGFFIAFYTPLLLGLAGWIWWPHKNPAARPWTSRILFWLWVISAAALLVFTTTRALGPDAINDLDAPGSERVAFQAGYMTGGALSCAALFLLFALISVGIGTTRRLLARRRRANSN